jgi:HK97 family phage portal protein
MALLSVLQRAKPPVVRVTANRGGDALVPMAIWQGWPGYDSYPYATEAEVLGLPVVGGFLGITSSLLFQMPLRTYRGSEILDNTPIVRNPTPGPARTFTDFIGEYLRDMFLFGNYVAILGPPNPTGWPDVMLPVPAGQWEIQVIGNEWRYLINGREFTPDQMFHVTMNGLTGELVGRGVMTLYPRLIASCVAAEKWAAQYFEGGAVPPGAVTSADPELTQANADILKAKMKAVAMAREWAVLPHGTSLEVLSSDAEKAQLNETRRLNAQQLAMAIGIPGALLGMDSPSLTYRNITDVFQQFITTTVMQYLVPLEQQFTLQCLPRGQVARFLPGAVLRPDLEGRVKLAVDSVQAGLYTTEEALAFYNLGPANFVTDILPNG